MILIIIRGNGWLSRNDTSMKTLQTSIVIAIKAIRPSKTRADELTVYKFVKKELHLITNTNVNNTLKILSEMGKIKTSQQKIRVLNSLLAIT